MIGCPELRPETQRPQNLENLDLETADNPQPHPSKK